MDADGKAFIIDKLDQARAALVAARQVTLKWGQIDAEHADRLADLIRQVEAATESVRAAPVVT